MSLISRDSTFTKLFVTVHVGPAALLVGGGLGAHDTYRHGGKGKICFIVLLFNYKPIAKKTILAGSELRYINENLQSSVVEPEPRSRNKKYLRPQHCCKVYI
jgi:hypothetical protein